MNSDNRNRSADRQTASSCQELVCMVHRGGSCARLSRLCSEPRAAKKSANRGEPCGRKHILLLPLHLCGSTSPSFRGYGEIAVGLTTLAGSPGSVDNPARSCSVNRARSAHDLGTIHSLYSTNDVPTLKKANGLMTKITLLRLKHSNNSIYRM